MDPRMYNRSFSERRSYTPSPIDCDGKGRSTSEYRSLYRYAQSASRSLGRSGSRSRSCTRTRSRSRSCTRTRSRSRSRSRSCLRSRSPSYTSISQQSEQEGSQSLRKIGPHTPESRHKRTSSRSYSRSTTPSSYNYRRKRYNNSHASSSPYSRSSRDRPQPNRCIGVFGLNVITTQTKIREIFSKYGPIERIQVVIDGQTGQSRGFCFVYFKNLKDAKSARYYCCGLEVDGRRIRVDYSITTKSHTPTPGVYKGRNRKYHRCSRRRFSSRCSKCVTNSNDYHSRRRYYNRFKRSSSYSYSSKRSRCH